MWFENEKAKDINLVVHLETLAQEVKGPVKERVELILELKTLTWSLEAFMCLYGRSGYLSHVNKAVYGGIRSKMSFQGHWGGLGRRNAPIKYNDLYEDYFKKLSAACKRAKIDTKDLPMVPRCDNSRLLKEIKLKDNVITQLNKRVFKLEAIIQVFGRERTDVSLENLDFRQYCLNMEEIRLRAEQEESWRLQEQKMMKEVFVKRLKEEVCIRVEKEKLVNYEKEKNKRRHALMNSDHWKASTSRISNCKRIQHSSGFSSYYWAHRIVGKLHVACKTAEARWAMVGAYFVQILLQDSIPVWYADGSRYKVAWRDLDQVMLILNISLLVYL
ncbi:hypothetical protein Tco_0533031 [Tanacetum coccineum]